MITVRCPTCDAAYQLDAAKLPAGGRKLRCARCQTVWLAQAPVSDDVEAALPVTGQPLEESVVPSPPVEPEILKVDAAPSGNEEDVPFDELLPPVDDVMQRAPQLKAVTGVGGWSAFARGMNIWRMGALAMILLGVGSGIAVAVLKLMPDEHVGGVEADVPAEQSAVEAKIIQPPQGIVLHRVRGEVTELEGENAGVALTVRGLLANTTSETLVVPPMRLELLGDDGKVADMWPVSGVSGTLSAHAENAWTVSLSAPDMSSIRGWRVVFVEDRPVAVSPTAAP